MAITKDTDPSNEGARIAWLKKKKEERLDEENMLHCRALLNNPKWNTISDEQRKKNLFDLTVMTMAPKKKV